MPLREGCGRPDQQPSGRAPRCLKCFAQEECAGRAQGSAEVEPAQGLTHWVDWESVALGNTGLAHEVASHLRSMQAACAGTRHAQHMQSRSFGSRAAPCVHQVDGLGRRRRATACVGEHSGAPGESAPIQGAAAW